MSSPDKADKADKAESGPGDKEYVQFLKEIEKMKLEEKIEGEEDESSFAIPDAKDFEIKGPMKPKVAFRSEEETLLLQALVASVGRQIKTFKTSDDPQFEQAARVVLRYRNYDIKSATERLVRYSEWRRKHKVYEMNFKNTPFAKYYSSQVAMVLPRPDREGRMMVWYRVKFDDPKAYKVNDIVKMVHYMDFHEICRRGGEAQLNGICLIIDQRGSSFKNMDMRGQAAWKEVFKAWPFRFGKFLVVQPNAVFSAVLPVFKRILGNKLFSRMYLVHKIEDLAKHIDPAHLPPELGGTEKVDYEAFVKGLDEPLPVGNNISTLFCGVVQHKMQLRAITVRQGTFKQLSGVAADASGKAEAAGPLQHEASLYTCFLFLISYCFILSD
eukprot:g40018.t1